MRSAPFPDHVEASTQTCCHRLPEDCPVALQRSRPVVSEPEEIPALRFAWAAARWTLERHELRLLGMQDQSELFEAAPLAPLPRPPLADGIRGGGVPVTESLLRQRSKRESKRDVLMGQQPKQREEDWEEQ